MMLGCSFLRRAPTSDFWPVFTDAQSQDTATFFSLTSLQGSPILFCTTCSFHNILCICSFCIIHTSKLHTDDPSNTSPYKIHFLSLLLWSFEPLLLKEANFNLVTAQDTASAIHFIHLLSLWFCICCLTRFLSSHPSHTSK